MLPALGFSKLDLNSNLPGQPYEAPLCRPSPAGNSRSPADDPWSKSLDLRSLCCSPPGCRRLFSQQAFPGCHPYWALGWLQEGDTMGNTEPGRTDSRLVAGNLVEAAVENEVAQFVFLQGCEGIRQARQNVDVVEAVPLPHCIHP